MNPRGQAFEASALPLGCSPTFVSVCDPITHTCSGMHFMFLNRYERKTLEVRYLSVIKHDHKLLVEKCCLLPCFTWLVLLSLLSYALRDHLSGGGSTHSRLFPSPNPQSVIEKIHRRPIWWDISLTGGSNFQNDSIWYQLDIKPHRIKTLGSHGCKTCLCHGQWDSDNKCGTTNCI